jgi:hypothetical protein
MLDHLSRCRVEFAPGMGVLAHELLRRKSPFYGRRERSRRGPGNHREGVDRCPPEQSSTSLRLFGTQVIPAFP